MSSRNRSQLALKTHQFGRILRWILAHPEIVFTPNIPVIPRIHATGDTHNRNFATRSAVTTFFVREIARCAVLRCEFGPIVCVTVSVSVIFCDNNRIARNRPEEEEVTRVKEFLTHCTPQIHKREREGNKNIKICN